MADGMTMQRALFAAAALTLGAGSAAQGLTDPTRPPLELMRTAAPAQAQGEAGAPSGPLQSILLSSTRQGAVLGGQFVPLGGKFGNATLVRVSATDVTLKGDKGMEVLHLYAPAAKSSAAVGSERNPDKAARTP